MIREITIENFKSIPELKLELGRVNVLIGENGCGKSNILEAIAFAGAAEHNSFDPAFLALRGIRVTDPRFMRSAFQDATTNHVVKIAARGQPPMGFELLLTSEDGPEYGGWIQSSTPTDPGLAREVDEIYGELGELARGRGGLSSAPGAKEKMRKATETAAKQFGQIGDFLVYSPENSALRFFQTETQLRPLGVRGEGLFAHLKALNERDGGTRLTEITDRLALLDWFERLEIPRDLVAGEHKVDIRDRYLPESVVFDQRSANEGFLFLLFYFTLLMSPDTPSFFAIDNIDASLNPKLCAELMRQLVALAEEHGKQVIFTTHNPALLDGLDRTDDDQRLFVVYRNLKGHTTVRRVGRPKHVEGATPVALSEAFMRGYIGGLPENF